MNTGPSPEDIDTKLDTLNKQVAKLLSAAKFEWKLPTGIELQTGRDEYKNQWGYSVQFMKEQDIFGENRYFGRPAKKPSMKNITVTGGGQLNITTEEAKTPQPIALTEKDIAEQQIAEDQLKKGEIRIEMNFTPIIAHRYLQHQINDMCKAIYQEKDLNA